MRESYGLGSTIPMLQMICDPGKDVVWRVCLNDDLSVTMKYIGYLKKHAYDATEYSTLDKAPEWVKHRIAVLNMMPANAIDSSVYGVGRRIDRNTFWIVEPEDADGIDAGDESQG